MGMGQNPGTSREHQVIAGIYGCSFIPLKMVSIGIDPLPISSKTILTSFNIYKLLGEPSCNAPGIHGIHGIPGIHGRIQFHHGATKAQRNQDGPLGWEKMTWHTEGYLWLFGKSELYMSYVYIYKKNIKKKHKKRLHHVTQQTLSEAFLKPYCNSLLMFVPKMV